MAAGLGFKAFNTGDVLSASDTNGYLMQGTWVFADAAARSAAVTSPQEGNMSYLKDTNSTEYYSGSAWVAIGGASGGLTLISETVASANSSIAFNSIPSTYKQLYVIWSGLKLDAAQECGFAWRFNNDSGSNYASMSSRASGTAISVNASLGDNADVYAVYGSLAETDIQRQGAGCMLIDNYASTTKYKAYNSQFGFAVNSGTNQSYVTNATYVSTSAITSLNLIRFTGSTTMTNATNTSIRLYGIS